MEIVKIRRPFLDYVSQASYCLLWLLIAFINYKSGHLGFLMYLAVMFLFIFFVRLITKLIYPPLMLRDNIILVTLDNDTFPRKFQTSLITRIEYEKPTTREIDDVAFCKQIKIVCNTGDIITLKNNFRYDELIEFLRNAVGSERLNEVQPIASTENVLSRFGNLWNSKK